MWLWEQGYPLAQSAIHSTSPSEKYLLPSWLKDFNVGRLATAITDHGQYINLLVFEIKKDLSPF